MPASDERIRARLTFLESEAREHPRRHAARLSALVVLGYAYPLALSGIAFGFVLLVLAAGPLVIRGGGEAVIFWIFAVIAALLLLVSALRAFSVSMPKITGQELRDGEAPALRALIDEVRTQAGGVPIHHLYLDFDLNAAAAQRKRFGLWGPTSNYLLIGLPLLILLTPQQLKSVVAHEIGHLHGRHNLFGAWIYRVFQTWESLAGRVQSDKGRFRRALIGWFVRWYGGYLATSSLALRRLHEYAADRCAADCVGVTDTAGALIRLSHTEYRLHQEFWPEMFSRAGREQLPPQDILALLAQFICSPESSDLTGRWRTVELRSRTPITADHPCLLERLGALGAQAALSNGSGNDPPPAPDSGASCIALLGDIRRHAWAVANSSWKLLAIQRWRHEYAYAEYLRDRVAGKEKKQAASGQPPPVELQWERRELEARVSPPREAIALLRQFTREFPDHASSHFALGQMLLREDDDSGAQFLETAIRHDSDLTSPALERLLEYYRGAGRDAEAEPIRQRLVEYGRALARARKERQKVSARDRLLPHGLSPDELEKLRRVLNRYPQIRSAHLARKETRLFKDKPSYVLALDRRAPALEDHRGADKALAASVNASVGISCAVVILGWSSRRIRAKIARVCPEPVFVAMD